MNIKKDYLLIWAVPSDMMKMFKVSQFCASAKLYHQATEQHFSSGCETLQFIFSTLPIFIFNSMTYPTLADVLNCLYMSYKEYKM